MTTALATIFVFGLIVFIHELGHFITAKMSGMQVDEFAIGFGPAIFKVQKGETLYLSLIHILLTNFKTIETRIKRLKQLEAMAEDGTFEVLPKKEVIGLRHEMEKLERCV